jgi:HK97 family phage portal protein
MILATRNGNLNVRSVFGADTSIVQPGRLGTTTTAGEGVTARSAVGLPALGRAVRLVAGVIASTPLGVFEGTGGQRRERPETPQARLLDNPVAGLSTYDWKYDIACALETNANAFLLKVRTGEGRVTELQPIPPELVYAHVDRDGNKQFDIYTTAGRVSLTTLDVLHIRGDAPAGGPFGVSRFMQHSDPVGAMQAAQRFEGAYYRNSARPDIAIIFQQGITRQQAAEWKQDWDAKYAGASNAGQALGIAGATIQPIPASMRDAQFVEGREFNTAEAARIADLDPVLLSSSTEVAGVRQEALEVFLKMQLPPRLRRIEGAFKADLDLFPLGGTLYPQFVVDDLMFADPLTRAQVQHFRIQDGSELVDEARADNGRPPLPAGAGQVPQLTPVGGAPNPQPVAEPE